MARHYKIKEIFYTLQGEGFFSGHAAVFVRFTGCNLWSGREVDRAKSVCQFCDTEFIGTDGINGGEYTAVELCEKISSLWRSEEQIFVVITGGEPLLQMDDSLMEVMHSFDIFIAIETNGTINAPEGIDWICVSPKSNSNIVLTRGNELKLVYPQDDCSPDKFVSWSFDHFYLQPKDDDNKIENTQKTVQYCMEHPKWKLSLQTHKILGIE